MQLSEVHNVIIQTMWHYMTASLPPTRRFVVLNTLLGHRRNGIALVALLQLSGSVVRSSVAG
jgi:hypothetical protein